MYSTVKSLIQSVIVSVSVVVVVDVFFNTVSIQYNTLQSVCPSVSALVLLPRVIFHTQRVVRRVSTNQFSCLSVTYSTCILLLM